MEEALLISIDEENGQACAEPIHNSLINFWPKCLKWIDEFGKENLLLQRQLWQAVLDRIKSNDQTQSDGFRNMTIAEPLTLSEKEDVLTSSSALWDNSPKLLEVLNQILFTPAFKKRAGVSSLGEMMALENKENEWPSPLEGRKYMDEEYFIKLFAPFSEKNLRELFMNADHWLNDGEVNFIVDSWIRKNNRLKKIMEERDAAIQAKKEAEQQRELAEVNLKKANDANEKVFKSFIEDIESNIKNMDYNTALDKTKVAIALNINKEISLKQLLEIAFWYNESGDQNQAITVLDTSMIMMGENKISTSLGLRLSRQKIQNVIKHLDKNYLANTHYDFLMRRYYPHPIPIKGDTIRIGKEEEIRNVVISDYAMAETATTWWQIALFRKAKGIFIKKKYANWNPTADHPVVNISWYDAVEYANWVSEQLGFQKAYRINKKEKDPFNKNPNDTMKWTVIWDRKANGFHLPTEAQWEYAAKTDDYTLFSGTSSKELLQNYCNYQHVHLPNTTPVKFLKPNKWGLYDMSGNVFEWCWNWNEQVLPQKLEVDYAGPKEGMHKNLKGGSWRQGIGIQVCVGRNHRAPSISNVSYEGFRLAK